MNRQELIEKYELELKDVQLKFGASFKTKVYEDLIEDLKQLDDEKEKVTLPRPVANWISCVRGRNKTLHFALENAPEEVNLWFCEDEVNRQNIFARAWLDGYTVEEEKRYYIRLKNVDENYNYLTCIKHLDAWALTEIKRDKKFRTEHTKKQLEEGGFGEVFDSPLFEVEEVQDDSKI